MLILGIETSCDETGIALVEADGGMRAPRFTVLKNYIASQIKIHRPFGGVVPNLAKREHLKNLPMLYRKIFGTEQRANSLWKKIDFIAVTVGPGLEPALWTGIEFAKILGKESDKPVIGTSHLDGHLYSFLLPQKSSNVGIVRDVRNEQAKRSNKRSDQTWNIFPAIALIVSGGHTILLKMDSLTKWRKLGETRDDAVGEAFDKVARILGLPYPGGPEIAELAEKGNPDAIAFPRPMLRDKNYDFSFSGLKTSVLYYLRDNPKAKKADVAASFQNAAIDVLVHKTARAAQVYGAKSILLSGGVASNKLLRKTLQTTSYKLQTNFLVADAKYNTDNAVMIAAAGYMAHLRKKKYNLEARGDLGI